MGAKLHMQELLLELLLLYLYSIKIFEDLFSLSIVSNVKNKINLFLPEVNISISLALYIDQCLDEFIFFHFSLHNLDIGLGFNNFNRKVLKDIDDVLIELFGLHLTKLKISVLVVPNNAGLLLLDVRPLCLVHIPVHDKSHLLNPSAKIYKR